MADSTTGGTHRLSYERARRLILIGGLLLLLIVAGVMYARRVEPVEVSATLLFIPVFVALMFWGTWGGAVMGVLAAAAYAVLRLPAIDAVGFDRFAGLIASRTVAYLAFGLIGGWSIRQLEKSLSKLELYDQIDDATRLYNARFFVENTDLEKSRSQRYQTVFSVVLVDVPAAAFDSLSARSRRNGLQDIGRLLRSSVRTVDRAVHASDGTTHHFAVVLPETGAEGAGVFVDRMVDKLADHLRGRGVKVTPETVRRRSATFPEDEAALEEMRAEFARIDALERPTPSSTDP